MEASTPEVRSLKDGEYVGVRRFTRILERGPEAKGDLDKVIDRCGSLVNLRTAIMRYRKPRRWFRFYRFLPCPDFYLPSHPSALLLLALTPTCHSSIGPDTYTPCHDICKRGYMMEKICIAVSLVAVAAWESNGLVCVNSYGADFFNNQRTFHWNVEHNNYSLM